MTDQIDKFSKWFIDSDSPAYNAYDLTPSLANTAHTTRALYVGETGTVVVELAGVVSGNTVTFTAVPAGTILPIRARLVSTVSTANSFVGMF